MQKKVRTKIKNTHNIVLAVSIISAIVGFMEMPNVLAVIIKMISFAGFLYLSFFAIKEKRWTLTVIYTIAGMFSKPFYGFTGGRTLWNIIDLILIIVIIFSLYKVVINYTKPHKKR